MTQQNVLTLPDLQALADSLRQTSTLIEATARRRAAPAVSPAKRRRAKAEPVRGIDIGTLDGLSDREAAQQLGAGKGASRYWADVVRQARRNAALPRGYALCEAGVAGRLGLRCDLAAVPGEPWCRTHHPDPPPAVEPPPSERKLARIAEDELRWRPDGRVLEALYAQTDAFHQLTAELRWHRDHVEHFEQLEAAKGKPAWMSVQQAAAYSGRSIGAIREGLARGNLKGTRPRGTKSWSLRPVDVDAWLSQEISGPPPRRRRG
jgi:transposase